MRIKSFLLYSVAILFTVSCTENSDLSEVEKETTSPLEFSAVIGEMQRNRSGMQDNIIAFGQSVWLWVDKADDGSKHIDSWQHISDGAGALDPIPSAKKYYPPGNAPVDIYGVHGNFGMSAGVPKPDSIVSSLMSNQTSPSDYLVSDLLWTSKLNQQAKDPIILQFKHMLSKIEICFKPVGSVTDAMIAGATPKVLGVRSDAKISLADGGGRTLGSLIDILFPLQTVPASAPDFSSATYAEIVVTPNEIKHSKNLFQLTCTNGDEYYYRPDSTFVMEPGKVYRFNMLVKQTIKIDPGSLDPWTPEDKNIVYEIVPMYVVPEVRDWNFENVNIEWAYQIIQPEVRAWTPEDGFSYYWTTPDVTSGTTQNPQP